MIISNSFFVNMHNIKIYNNRENTYFIKPIQNYEMRHRHQTRSMFTIETKHPDRGRFYGGNQEGLKKRLRISPHRQEHHPLIRVAADESLDLAKDLLHVDLHIPLTVTCMHHLQRRVDHDTVFALLITST